MNKGVCCCAHTTFVMFTVCVFSLLFMMNDHVYHKSTRCMRGGRLLAITINITANYIIIVSICFFLLFNIFSANFQNALLNVASN